MRAIPPAVLVMAALLAAGCGDDAPPDEFGDTGTSGSTSGISASTTSTTLPPTGSETGPEPEELDLYGFAKGCFAVRSDDQWLSSTADGTGFVFVDGVAGATSVLMQPSDLGTYLLYDGDRGYVVGEDGPLLRQTSLTSDVMLVDDTYISGAEWELQPSLTDPTRYQLRNRRTGSFMGAGGLTDEAQALPLMFEAAQGCVDHPELSVDAEGEVQSNTFEDGSLYGIVDTHSHILSNFGFGGGSIFHGAPFHRLGVEHALPDCEPFHGPEGRKDFFGFAFDTAGADGIDVAGFLPALIAGELEDPNHVTDGYPTFTEWPSAPTRSTHQMQYYRWLERAHMAGLRLVVQHATTNAVICELTAGEGVQPVRYSCDDMVAVDRIIEETYVMERYIDAQMGGPGQGWFRVVQTPQEAREVIESGKMAVVLGIETSDVFDCRLTPGKNSPVCDEDYVKQQLDRYYDLGVRVMFPVHKYDNAFSAGDGDRAFIELGNFVHSGHWSNFTLDCPEGVPSVFDKGDVAFGGLNMPRDQYDSPPPNDMSNFANLPLGTLLPFLSQIGEPALVGDYCQKTGLTPLGETLLTEMMARGMIIEIDHLPRKSYGRAFEMLEENDYPAAGTHGGNYDGRLYALGGISKTGLGRCRDPEQPGAMVQRLKDRVDLITANGGYPAEGFGFDLNGFAGAPGPRFGEGNCTAPQEDPITYPFDSFSGDVTFTQPMVGEREIDFNTEGLVHIGLMPELIEDARRDAVSDEDLEPLFRSAEGYIRMWERSEERGAALSGG